jgi:phosphoribosylglycinamide formyltransferase-1
LSDPYVNLIADLDDPRLGHAAVHHELEVLGERGIRPVRDHRTPERILGWIDAEFGGTWSSEAAAGGIWVAEDASGPVAFAAYDPRGLPFRWLRPWHDRDSVGIFGPIGVAARARKTGLGGVLARAAFFSLRERGYRRALVPVVAPDLVPFYDRIAGARVVESVHLDSGGTPARTVVLASGNGSNFQAVAEAAAAGALPIAIAGLVVNRPGAYALERARALGIPSTVVAWDRAIETRSDFDARVIDAVAAYDPELVLLLGWMHVLPAAFVERYPDTLNVHPAFLPLDPAEDFATAPDFTRVPAFRGARALDDALAAGSAWAGASVHRVGVAVDRGAVLARLPLALERPETRAELDARLHEAERSVVRSAIRRWSWERP